MYVCKLVINEFGLEIYKNVSNHQPSNIISCGANDLANFKTVDSKFINGIIQ